MKNQSFLNRLRYSVNGIKIALWSEASFRTQIFFAICVCLFLVVLKPEPIWWALVFLTTGAVLAAELLNTSLEFVVDRLHPEVHPMIGKAKDCAAGAVLILSSCSIAVFIAMLIEHWSAIRYFLS